MRVPRRPVALAGSTTCADGRNLHPTTRRARPTRLYLVADGGNSCPWTAVMIAAAASVVGSGPSHLGEVAVTMVDGHLALMLLEDKDARPLAFSLRLVERIGLQPWSAAAPCARFGVSSAPRCLATRQSGAAGRSEMCLYNVNYSSFKSSFSRCPKQHRTRALSSIGLNSYADGRPDRTPGQVRRRLSGASRQLSALNSPASRTPACFRGVACPLLHPGPFPVVVMTAGVTRPSLLLATL